MAISMKFLVSTGACSAHYRLAATVSDISSVSMYCINFVAVVNCLEHGMVCGHIPWLLGKTPYVQYTVGVHHN